jgi:putative sterol carrier protein
VELHHLSIGDGDEVGSFDDAAVDEEVVAAGDVGAADMVLHMSYAVLMQVGQRDTSCMSVMMRM